MHRLINLLLPGVVAILTGCCTPEVIFKEVEVPIPGIKDTIIAVQDSIETQDTIFVGWAGVVYKDNSKDTAASAIFIPDTKEMIIDVKPDTIKIVDTVHTKESQIIMRGDEGWEKVLWIVGTALIGFVAYFIRNKRRNKKPES